MGEGFFDRNLKRLLGRARRPVEAKPFFRKHLLGKLQEEAARMRGENDLTAASLARGPRPSEAKGGVEVVPDPASPATMARRPGWGAAAAAILVIAFGGFGVWRWVTGDDFEKDSGPIVAGLDLVRRESPLVVPGRGGTRVLGVSKDAQGSAVLEDQGTEVARLELMHGAEVALGSGLVPVLTLDEGVLRVQTQRALQVRAATVVVAVAAGSDVEIEHVIRSGEGTMNKSWLIPGGLAVAAGATAVAILVHKGSVEVDTPESRRAPVAVEKPVIIEIPTSRPVADDDRDKLLAEARRRIAELEKKLAAAKKESEKLGRDLVEKKGVTIDQIAARLAELKKNPGKAILPGTTNDLIADLKGLGPAGLQAVLDLLKSTDPADRALAAKLLEDMKDPAAIPALREVALNDTDPKTLNQAVHALALIGDRAAADTLREVLARKRSDADVINSLWGLVNLADPQGMEQALAYMNDPKVDKDHRAILVANIAYLMTDRPDVMPMVDASVRDFPESRQMMTIAVDYYRAMYRSSNANVREDARSRLQAIADNTQVAESVRTAARNALNQ